MKKLTEEEKMELKLSLGRKINEWLEKETQEDNNIGWLPDNITTLMTSAAFNVIEATQSLNVLMEREDLLK